MRRKIFKKHSTYYTYYLHLYITNAIRYQIVPHKRAHSCKHRVNFTPQKRCINSNLTVHHFPGFCHEHGHQNVPLYLPLLSASITPDKPWPTPCRIRKGTMGNNDRAVSFRVTAQYERTCNRYSRSASRGNPCPYPRWLFAKQGAVLHQGLDCHTRRVNIDVCWPNLQLCRLNEHCCVSISNLFRQGWTIGSSSTDTPIPALLKVRGGFRTFRDWLDVYF